MNEFGHFLLELFYLPGNTFEFTPTYSEAIKDCQDWANLA